MKPAINDSNKLQVCQNGEIHIRVTATIHLTGVQQLTSHLKWLLYSWEQHLHHGRTNSTNFLISECLSRHTGQYNLCEIKDRTKGGIFTHSVKNHFKWIRKRSCISKSLIAAISTVAKTGKNFNLKKWIRWHDFSFKKVLRESKINIHQEEYSNRKLRQVILRTFPSCLSF